MSRPPADYLPVEPLAQRVQAAGGLRHLLPRGHALERTYLRAVSVGRVTVNMADRLAIALLAEHPCAVWGEDWWATPEEAGDTGACGTFSKGYRRHQRRGERPCGDCRAAAREYARRRRQVTGPVAQASRTEASA